MLSNRWLSESITKRCPVFTEGKRMPWQRPLGKEEKGKAYLIPEGPLSQMTESSIRAKIAWLRLTIGFLAPCFGSTNSPHIRCCRPCFFLASPPIQQSCVQTVRVIPTSEPMPSR